MPPLLILGGISGAGMMTVVEDYRPFFMLVTFGLLGGSFYLTYRPRPEAVAVSSHRRSRMMTFNKITLWAVTVIAVVLLFFPHTVVRYFPTGDVFTAEMDQTVIRIEGMT